MVRTSIAAVLGVLVATSGIKAQLVVSSGFESGDPWSLVLINPMISPASIVTSGGNPDGYAELQPTLQGTTSGGVGFRWAGPGVPLNVGGLSTISISADYKHFSGPAADLLPFLLQGNLLFYPFSGVITLGTSPEWASVGTFNYPISELANLSGFPFDPLAPAHVGFWVRIRSSVPTTVSSRIGIDNITLQVVPAPASMVLSATALLWLARRRRAVL